MIQAWQLKPGVYLHYPFLASSKLVKVIIASGDKAEVQWRATDSKGEKYLCEEMALISDLRPIKITDTWLINLGFTLSGRHWIKDNFSYCDNVVYALYANTDQVQNKIRIDVYDVHDLQQLIISYSSETSKNTWPIG